MVPWLLVAAVAATPTPAPVALQYDEISRIIVAPATAPAPGAFADDYKLAMSARPAHVSQSSSIDTPTLKSRGISGSLAESIPGEPGGTNTSESLGDAVSNGASNAAPSAGDQLMHAGRVTRYTFYVAKTWVREDSPVLQTAAIAKCDQHIVILLDLAKKTYRQMPIDCSTMPGPHESSTEDLAIDTTASQDLGSLTIDGVKTTGSRVTLSETAGNATGTCKNSQSAYARVAYVSKIPKPPAYYPITWAPGILTDPVLMPEQGGCKPTLHGNGASTIAADPMLEMYVMTDRASSDHGRTVHTLTERGNVTALDAAAADPLFEIPAGFSPAR